MARRSSFLEDLTHLPWQVSVALAFACYPVALIIVGSADNNPILKGFSIVALSLWPMFAFFFLFIAGISFLKSRQKSNLFQSNRSLSKIQSLTWRQFEYYVGEMFLWKGYFVIEKPEYDFF